MTQSLQDFLSDLDGVGQRIKALQIKQAKLESDSKRMLEDAKRYVAEIEGKEK